MRTAQGLPSGYDIPNNFENVPIRVIDGWAATAGEGPVPTPYTRRTAPPSTGIAAPLI